MTTALAIVAFVGLVAAWIPSGLRWLRVAQREHYLPGATSPFFSRWWSSSFANVALAACGGAALVLVALERSTGWSVPTSVASLLLAGVVAIGPLGLSVRGRTSKLVFTERCRRLTVVTAIVGVVLVAGFSAMSNPLCGAAVVGYLMPLWIDLSAWLLRRGEDRRAQRFVDRAADRLAEVRPRVVAITGSYGKTSTKRHLAQLLEGSRATVATPASFNNRAGLARAINEQLADGTEVFIAEMGTYGPGEIAALCAWIPPEIAVLTAIGPVHLERFGTLEVTLASKAEICEGARVVVVNADDDRLAALATSLESVGRVVRRCSSRDPNAAVAVCRTADGVEVSLDGKVVASGLNLPGGVQPTNVACAIAAAVELGVDPAVLASRLARLEAADHRAKVQRAPSGVMVIDDTFNANPAGAAAALATLAGLDAACRFVVTPGMIELGSTQAAENEAFARAAAAVADVVVVVGRTNRRALRRGLRAGRATVIELANRPSAVDYIRATATARDAVLYENDLPDHYP